jgi:glycosyltransferase involved in cell wall biosynthesis
MTDKQPLLSVRLMAYNNVGFIKAALDGCLIQETNFPFEIVVGDDFSTDGTAEIIKDYAKRFPDKVRMLDRPVGGTYYVERLKKGRVHNWVDIVNNCKGKYIAVLDGDDYWTDKNKLQIQVDFLEKNQDFSICFHRVQILRGEKLEAITNPNTPEETDFDYLIAQSYYLNSSSIVFNKEHLIAWPDWVYQIFSMDVCVQAFLTLNGGKVKMLQNNMAIYRLHGNSLLSEITNDYFGSLLKSQTLYSNIQKEVPENKKALLELKTTTYNQSIFLHHTSVKKKKDLWETLASYFVRISLKIGKSKIEKIKNLY